MTNCRSDIHKRTTCPLLPCSSCGEIGHTSTTCPINMEGRKTSDRIAHRKEQLSKELIERQNDRHGVEHMSDAQIDRQNDRHR